MLYIILILIIFMLYMFIYYIIHKNTNIVDGEIIRVDKVRNLKLGITTHKKFDTTITYSYIVNNKKHISTMIDDFEISDLLYKYIKTKSNEKFFKDKYTYYVKKKDIKVRYKINNPQDSKINNFILKEIIYLLIIAMIFTLIGIIILGLIWYKIYR